MERMWRKVNQGLISKPTASGKIRGGGASGSGQHPQNPHLHQIADNPDAAAYMAGPVGASAVGSLLQPSATSAFVPVPSSASTLNGHRSGTHTGHRGQPVQLHQPQYSNQQQLQLQQGGPLPVPMQQQPQPPPHPSMMRSSTGAMHRTSRRSQQLEPRDDGGAGGGGGGQPPGGDQLSLHVRHPAKANSTTSTESRRRRRRKSKTRCNKNNSIRMNPSSSNVELIATKETSLRERALSKFRLLNFNINWNMHITGCRPCRSNNSNIITRRLCRNRSRIDDNELYRSNSFKFERFKRKDMAGENASSTLPRPVSVCDDYSLPVDFVKKIDPTAPHAPAHGLGSARSLHLPTSHTAPSPLTANNAGSAGHLEPIASDHGHSSSTTHNDPWPLKVIAGYSQPKDRQIEVVEECESNDQLCSSANSSLPESSDDEADPPIASGRNSPESLIDDPQAAATRISTLNPSPYYYSDLLAKNQQQQQQPQNPQLAAVTRDEPIYAIRYKQPTSTNDSRPPKKKVYSQKRYSVVEEGVHIIKCETPSTSSTSDDSNCTECRQRREQDHEDRRQLHQLDDFNYSAQLSQRSNSADYVNELHHHHHHQQHHQHHHQHPAGTQMPPHRLLDPTLCACTAAPSTSGDAHGADGDADFPEIFRPRSIFYVHDDNENGCADCCLSHSDSGATGGTNTTNTTTNNTVNRSVGRGRSRDRAASMRNGRCGLYETAFDSKVGRSDDDLDEMSRINSAELLSEAAAGAGASAVAASAATTAASKPKARSKHGLRLKSSHSSDSQDFEHARRPHSSRRHLSAKTDNSAAALAQDFEQMQINAILNGEQLSAVSTSNLGAAVTADMSGGSVSNVTAAGSSRFHLQLQLQQHPPSPPSTAPLPLKFPHHHHNHHHHHHHPTTESGGMFGVMPNNNQSAPDLPHPRRSIPANAEAGAAGPDLAAPSTSAAGAICPPGAAPAFVLGTPPSQQHSRLRQLRQHHHSTSGEQQGSSATIHSDSSSMTGAVGGAHPAHLQVRPPRTQHKERPQSMHAATDKRPHPLKNKRLLREHIRPKVNYSSTESMNTSSSASGSLESLRSSNSEGNRSTTSYESRHSTSLSSHSSDSGSRRALYPLRTAALMHSKMHILSPISDKSSLEHNAELGDSGAGQSQAATTVNPESGAISKTTQQRRLFVPPTRAHQLMACSSGPGGDEILGSDSGISLQSRDGGKSKSAFQPFSSSIIREKLNIGGPSAIGCGPSGAASGLSMPEDIASLPFDMPKLVRRRQQLLEQKQCTSDSATSVDLGDLPFDMPKLKRRLRQSSAAGGNTAPTITAVGGLAFPLNPALAHLMPGGGHTSTESSGLSHASSSQSMREDKLSEFLTESAGMFRQNLTLHFNPEPTAAPCLQLDVSRTNKGLHLNLAGAGAASAVDGIDVDLPLERQSWYHGAITRIEAENILRPLNEGCFLVRNCESSRHDFSLSLKSAKGFMHMRIQQNDAGQYILGQFSQPFGSISEIIRHYCLNRLPVRGAEHMCLLEPVAAQLL